MSTDLVAIDEWTPSKIDLLRRTICKGATDDEMALFLTQCRRTGLDPLTKQCHAVKRWDSKERREVMTIQVGIDGLRLIADRTGKYAGNDEPVYDREDADHPNKATVTVWKLVGGTRQPFTRSARWSEFVQTTKEGTVTRFWAKMPFLMLGKVAEALALRAAFPQELSGLYTDDEMSQADKVDDHGGNHPQQVPAPAVQQPKPAALPAGGQHQSPPVASAIYTMLSKTLQEAVSREDIAKVKATANDNRGKMSQVERDSFRDDLKMAEEEIAAAEAERSQIFDGPVNGGMLPD